MKNWKLVAEGLGLDIPDADLEGSVRTLDALCASFSPLAKEIPEDVEPAVIFSVEPEERA
ncbi:MAG: hypothetical protein ABFD60_14955 [Bryobacteraceae bacterium]